MDLKLHVWRQAKAGTQGKMVQYEIKGVSPDSSFLEMLDLLNEQLIEKGQDPVAFDHDCREGICGSCSLVINGKPHGPEGGTTTCQLHMRSFKSGDEIYIEPWRAKAFPILKDLVVDRSAFDRIIASGGYISVNTGNAQDANATPINKHDADKAFDAATCIGCGACVAACKNASAMLFVSAKVGQLALLPQGQPERLSRAKAMVETMDNEGFGACTNTLACGAVCPKEISTDFISKLNCEFIKSTLTSES
ncbi:MAG: succinate dehydrogenase/fumarate reductase iron-sulfur subunit [Oligoflexales bacterium]|jgi:succinate dehydrogenase / fumarate reductase iron-sulfur subunit|nr:succinate dehydrogenase/fumarate reductase iron-sulfur subunit [Oligoflexales bacterium]